jgi:urease accessory protein
MVGADLDVMTQDAQRVRNGLPVISQSLVDTPDAPEVAAWVNTKVLAPA